jgi:hypothetical protein
MHFEVIITLIFLSNFPENTISCYINFAIFVLFNFNYLGLDKPSCKQIRLRKFITLSVIYIENETEEEIIGIFMQFSLSRKTILYT